MLWKESIFMRSPFCVSKWRPLTANDGSNLKSRISEGYCEQRTEHQRRFTESEQVWVWVSVKEWVSTSETESEYDYEWEWASVWERVSEQASVNHSARVWVTERQWVSVSEWTSEWVREWVRGTTGNLQRVTQVRINLTYLSIWLYTISMWLHRSRD